MLKQYKNLFDINETKASELFLECNHPFEVLPKIKEYIKILIDTLDEDYIEIKENVYVHKTANISETAYIKGPAIIGANTEVRHGAYIRGNAIIGDNCVIGNSTEIKNSILFNNSKCPHFNYVGDAILGEYSHIGAGVICSNVKSDNSNIVVKFDDDKVETGLRKFSTILGSRVEVGCNSVLCPGTIIFKNTNVYPLTRVRGVIKENKIVKDINNIVDKESD